MPFTLNGTELIIQFQQKHNELYYLQNILKSASVLCLLSEQKAPSVQLQKQDEVYFGDLMAIFAQCQLLYQSLDEALQQSRYSKEINEVMLKDIINISGDIKDAKQFAMQKIFAFKNSDAYQNMRESIGTNNLTQILNIINGADGLLSELFKIDWAKPYVMQKRNEIESQQMKRKYKQAKKELINSEKTFKEDMTTIVNFNKSFHLYEVLIRQHYPNLALFFIHSQKLQANAEKLHSIFQQADCEPVILVQEHTQKHLVSCYQALQEASILKCKIDRYELERFNSDNESSIIFLKKGIQGVDSRGLYSYICMPFQRLCRYPLLLKEIVSCLSKKEDVVAEHSDSDDSISKDKLSFQSFLELSLTLTKESNEIQRQLEDKLSNRRPWVTYSGTLSNRFEHLLCGRRSMPAKTDFAPPLPPRDICSSAKTWRTVDRMDSKNKTAKSKAKKSQFIHANRPLPIPPCHIENSEILSVRAKLKKPK